MPAAVTAVAGGKENKVDKRHTEQADVSAAPQQQQQQQHVGEARTAAAVAGPGAAAGACEEQPPAAVLASTGMSMSCTAEVRWFGYCAIWLAAVHTNNVIVNINLPRQAVTLSCWSEYPS
jgi:hypothetical protein